MPNDNIMGIETKACINGVTKSDVKKLDAIVQDENGTFLTSGDAKIGLETENDETIPVTEPYLPVDDEDNPIAPDDDVIMTSANVDVDPRIVRTTGNQTIDGEKTFTSEIKENTDIPSITMISSKTNQENSSKMVILSQDMKDGIISEHSSIVSGSSPNDGYEYLKLIVKVPNRSRDYQLNIRSYAGHQIILCNPYYPTDVDDNPQPLTASALVASGNIAVDPRIFHTTGNETIAGNKTFNGTIINDNSLDNRHNCVVGWTDANTNWWEIYEMDIGSYSRGTMINILDVNSHEFGYYYIFGFSNTIAGYRFIGSFSSSRILLTKKDNKMKIYISTTSSSNRLHIWCGQDVQAISNTPHPLNPVFKIISPPKVSTIPTVGTDFDIVSSPTDVNI